MLTRCPHCQTAFRVTSEQLKLRQGQVRCGECRGVFDALESLADELPAVLTAVPEPEPAAAALLPEPEAEPEAGDVPEPEPEVSPETEPETEPELAVEPEPEPEAGLAPEPGAELQEASQPEPLEEEDVATADGAWDGPQDLPPPAPRRWPRIAGTLALVLLALGQLLFIYRVELAVLAPGLRPVLAGACDLFGCAVPRPRKPELASIESSDLAPEEKEQLLLTATLRNRAPFDQEYPHLELTLTDARDAAILRKVLAPADYLPADQSPAAGFAARGEVAVRLLLEAKGVPAVGYRLYLFYP
jgi:predicted Zn finger-like uncharacterized protein